MYQNSHSIGIEAEATGTSSWPDEQIEAYAKLCKALCKEFKLSTSRVVGHKEACSPSGRKLDPNFSMSDFRAKVGGAKGGVSTSTGSAGSGGKYESPKAKHRVGSRVMGLNDGGTDVQWLQKRLYKLGYRVTPKSNGSFDSLFSPELEKAVKALQKKAGIARDGLAGKDTIKAAKKAKAKRKLPKKNKAKPPRKSQKAPKFPLSRGHWYGVESSNRKNHSGYWTGDRAGIRKLQQNLKDRGWSIGVDGEGIGCGRTRRHQDLEGYLGGARHLI